MPNQMLIIIPMEFYYLSDLDQDLTPPQGSQTILRSHYNCSSKFPYILNLFSKPLLCFFALNEILSSLKPPLFSNRCSLKWWYR